MTFFRAARRGLLVGAVLTTSFLAAPFAVAADAAASVTERLESFLTGTLEGAGAFEQRVATKSGEEAAPTATGHFRFHRPGRFAWQYEAPYRQLIVSDGETLWFYDEDLAQATKSRLSGALPTSPASILFGTGRLDPKEWDVKEAGKRDGLLWIEARPKAAGVFERVEIGFGATGEAPVRMRLIDGFGQVTTLDFRDFRKEAVPASNFAWAVPDGVDVMEMNGP